MNYPGLDQLRLIFARWQRTSFASQPGPAEVAAPLPLVERLPAGAQWSKVASILEEAVQSAGRAGELQRSSSRQLDAASYALQILKFELAAAIAPPPAKDVQSNVIHMLRPLRVERRRAGIAA